MITFVAFLAAAVGSSRTLATPPTPERAMAAYQLVEQWVREWSVPAEPTREEVERLGAIGGAAVTLRLSGQIVGRGSSVDGGPGSLRQAARDAIAEANRRLPRGNDLLAEEAHQQTVARIMISLELAGAPMLITPPPQTYADASLALSPGLDGVMVRLGGADERRPGGVRTAVVFPGHMLASNTLPGAALATAVSQAAGDPALALVEPAELAEKHGATFLRFRTTHLAQTAPGEPPTFLDRGGRLVSMSDMTVEELRAMADRLAGHLLVRARDPEATATYEPWRDAFDGRPITPAELGLIALALRWHASVQPDAEVRARARAVAAEIATAAMERARRAVEEGEPGAAVQAAIVAAVTARIDRRAATDHAALRAVFDPVEGFAADLPASARGLIAYGLAFAIDHPESPEDAVAVAEAAVRAAFRQTPEGELVSQMPWLGWAEIFLVEQRSIRGLADPAVVPAAVALRRMREVLWEHQVRHEDVGRSGDDLDQVGGIVFTRGRTAIPTWQSARPLAFVATMLGDERLTDGPEFNSELVRLLTGLRFLRQLQADERAMWMYPNPGRALGGIRSSVWDQRMPVEASAITLMALCQTLQTLERRTTTGPQVPTD